MLFVKDVQQLRDFYARVANMKIKIDEASYAVLAIPHFELVIHAMAGASTKKSKTKSPVKIREDAYVKICLPVKNIAKARAEAETLGGLIQPARREWEARGFRACDGHDPEGNVFQLRESAE